MSNELSIILPTLNEGKNLEKLIPQIFEILVNKNIENIFISSLFKIV